MNARLHIRQLVVACVVSIGVMGITTQTFAQTPAKRIGGINPLVSVQEFPADRYPVVIGNAERSKPVAVNSLILLGDIMYASERGTQRWFVGRLHEDRLRRTAEVRVEFTFDSLDAVIAASAFARLPADNADVQVRELAQLPHSPVACVGLSKDVILVLLSNGDVWRVEPTAGRRRVVIGHQQYLDPRRGETLIRGMARGPDGRLYIAVNQMYAGSLPLLNEVTIFRTAADQSDPSSPLPWLRARYPWGLESFAHGVGPLAFGPDGMLYAGSGSRTDAGEQGFDAVRWKGGEHELTGSLWRVDPSTALPQVEIFASGLRQIGGIAWSADGKLYVTDSGVSEDGAAELNFVTQGAHYGFPYRSGNGDKPPKSAPKQSTAGLMFVPPLPGLPDSDATDEPRFTFAARTAPAGLAWLDDSFPAAWRGAFAVTRLGDAGTKTHPAPGDLLLARPAQMPDGSPAVRVRPMLAPLSRPVHVLAHGGRLYICEFARSNQAGYSQLLPGRLLEITPR